MHDELKISMAGQQVMFTGFNESSSGNTIKIYNLKGELLNAVSVKGRIALWDGCDVRGRAVPGGFYIASISSVDKSCIFTLATPK